MGQYVRVTSTIDLLAADLGGMPRRAAAGFVGAVRDSGRVGNKVAKESARRNSGRHGRLYPGTFTVDAARALAAFGAANYSVEYGPVSSKKQGGMAPGFEYGSRNQTRPHYDLAKSTDVALPDLVRGVRKVVDGLFW